jgi:hypothetical protein
MERTKIRSNMPGMPGPLGRNARAGLSSTAAAQEHMETVERSLWSTIVALEEAAEIAEHLCAGTWPSHAG